VVPAGVPRAQVGLEARKGVNTMMDLSSVIDASLTFAGVIAVIMMGTATLSSESTTVSTGSGRDDSRLEQKEYPMLRKAA
jgi:arginine exporter protein ArgO